MTGDLPRMRAMRADGKTLAEIADATGVALSTVRSWLAGDRTPRGTGCSWASLAPFLAGSATVAEQADRLGVARSSVRAWRDGQPIPWQTADRIAVRIGEHPAAIWADEWHDTKGTDG